MPEITKLCEEDAWELLEVLSEEDDILDFWVNYRAYLNSRNVASGHRIILAHAVGRTISALEQDKKEPCSTQGGIR